MSPEEVKNVVQQAYELARQASALMDEVYDLLVELDDDADEGAFQEVFTSSLAVSSACTTLEFWLSDLTPEEAEQESEPESAPATP
jgi:hypothetical protein